MLYPYTQNNYDSNLMQMAIPAAADTRIPVNVNHDTQPQKEYVRHWMNQMRKPMGVTFPQYEQSFRCSVQGDDWVARLELGYPGETEYALEVRLVDNDEDFLVTASNDMDCMELFSEIGLDGEGNVGWLHRNMNTAIEVITNHYFR